MRQIKTVLRNIFLVILVIPCYNDHANNTITIDSTDKVFKKEHFVSIIETKGKAIIRSKDRVYRKF